MTKDPLNTLIAPPTESSPRIGVAAEVNLQLRQLLRRLRRGIQRHVALECLAWMLVVAVAWCAVAYPLDWLLNMTRPQRAAILVLGLAVLAAIVIRFLWRPLRKRMSDEDLALVIENHFPHLEDRIITTIQLAPQQDTASHDALSAQLLDAVAEQAVDGVGRISVTEPLNRKLLFKRLFYGGAAVAAFALALIVAFDWMWVAIQRNPLLRNPPWPHETSLIVYWVKDDARVELNEANSVVRLARGSELNIEVEAVGERIPASVNFDLRHKDGRKLGDSVNYSGSANLFHKRFADLAGTFVFSVKAGRCHTPDFTVEVVDPPLISKLSFTLDYPLYTGLAQRTFGPGEGGLEAVAGTVVTVEATASKSLKSGFASLSVSSSTGVTLTSFEIKGDGVTGGSRFRGRFQLQDPEKHSGKLKFVLTDSANFTSEAYSYPLTTLADAPPAVKIQTKGISDRIVPSARVSLLLEAFDDFGVTQSNLVCELRDAGSATTTMQLPGAPINRKRFNFEYAWDVEALGLKPGDVLEFHAECLDYPQNIGKSGALQLRVVERRELAEDIQRQLKLYSAELDRLIGRRRQINTATKEMRDALQRGAPLAAPEQQQRFQEILAGERDAGNALQNLSEQVARLADEMENNRLGTDAEYDHWRARVALPLSDVSRHVLSPIVMKVSEAQAASQSTTSMDKLDLAIVEQDAVEARLDSISREMLFYIGWKELLKRTVDLQERIHANQHDLDDIYGKGVENSLHNPR